MSATQILTLIAIVAVLFLLGVFFYLKRKKDGTFQIWKHYLFWAMFFSATQEFLNIVIIQRDITNYFFSLLVFYLPYATICFLVYRKFIGFSSSNLGHHFFYIIFVGLFGLQFDWFILMNPPWQPGIALPAVILSNIGIFFFYGTIGFLSLMYLRKGIEVEALKKQSLKIYILFMAIIFSIGFFLSSAAYVIDLIVTALFSIYYFPKFLKKL